MDNKNFLSDIEVKEKKDVKENYFSIMTSSIIIGFITILLWWVFLFAKMETTNLQEKSDNLQEQIQTHTTNIKNNKELYSLLESLLVYVDLVEKITNFKPKIATIIKELEYIIPDDWNIAEKLIISNNKSTSLTITTDTLLWLLNFYNSLKNNQVFDYSWFDTIQKVRTNDKDYSLEYDTSKPIYSYSATFNLQYKGSVDKYSQTLEEKTPRQLAKEKKEDLWKINYINSIFSYIQPYKDTFSRYPCSSSDNVKINSQTWDLKWIQTSVTLSPDGFSSDKYIEFTYMNEKTNNLLDLLKVNSITIDKDAKWKLKYDEAPTWTNLYYLVDRSCYSASVCTSINNRQNVVDSEKLKFVSGETYEDKIKKEWNPLTVNNDEMKLKDNVLFVDSIASSVYEDKEWNKIRFFEDWKKTIIYKDLNTLDKNVAPENLTLNYLCWNNFDNSSSTKTNNAIPSWF